MNNDIEKELKELQIQYDKVLKERNELEIENKLLKKDFKEYQAYIKKGVEEHYKGFMSDYDVLLEECNGLNKDYKRVKRDLLYLQKNGAEIYVFPNGRKIFGFDITDCPSELEIRKEIIEDAIKNITEALEDDK